VSGYRKYYNCSHFGAGRGIDETETGHEGNAKEQKNHEKENSMEMNLFIFCNILTENYIMKSFITCTLLQA
jgi:hypothetical protein